MTILNIPDMSCGHCKARVEKAIHGLDAAASLTFDMGARRVEVHSRADLAAMQAALAAEGYPATVD